MSKRNAECLIALALALRGSALLFSTVAMRTIDVFTLIGIRFLLAFVVLAIIFHKRLRGLTRKELLHAAIIGFTLYLSMGSELIGLRTVPSSTTAFIENSAVVFVPLIVALIHRRLPDKLSLLCAMIGMVGIGFLTLKGSGISFTWGEFMVLMCALTFALSIIENDELATEDDTFRLGMMQLFFIGAFSMITAFITESPSIPSSAVEWGAILYLALICSGFGFTIMPVAQQYTTAERTSLLGAFNPLAASVLGILVLHENFTWSSVIGAVLILLSVMLPTILKLRKPAA